MGCSGHQSPGLFTHPSDKSVFHNKLSYWTDTAKLLEKGNAERFDKKPYLKLLFKANSTESFLLMS